MKKLFFDSHSLSSPGFNCKSKVSTDTSAILKACVHTGGREEEDGEETVG